MSDRGYLLKVLGISGLPKVATFLLTLVTVPVVLRSVGAEQYGVFLYVAAGLGVCEVLVDFGVSSAAGKNMAEVRATSPAAVPQEFLAWARLQLAFLVLGFGPMLAAAYWALGRDWTVHAADLLLVMAVTLGLNVVLNFVRPNLQSLLAFKSLAVLDTFESVTRSGGQIAAAYLLPTAMGLALAALCTAAAAGTLSLALVALRLKEFGADTAAAGRAPQRARAVRIRESLSFLWLRLSTRMFQELPTLIMGRMLGTEVVGIIGAFRRVVEILNTPYLVIGNALMVRVNEIHRKGGEAMQALWDAALRIVSTAIFVTALAYLAADLVAAALLPAHPLAPQIFRMLAPVVLLVCLIGVVAPMSDYLGALVRRNIILSVMALLQLPLQWLAIWHLRDVGAALAYVAAHALLALAYLLLAHRTFFGAQPLRLRREVLLFLLTCMSALALSMAAGPLVQAGFPGRYEFSPVAALAARVLTFCAFVVIILRVCGGTSKYYFRRDFLDFTH